MPEKLTIEDMQKRAEERDGKCLSKSYVNSETKLTWQCEKKHIWKAKPTHVRAGTWCPVCAGVKKANIEDIKALAISRGGKLLSKKYTLNRAPLEWECREGHTWVTSYSNVKRGTWCPICSSGVSERICRKIFELLFEKKFPKARPGWLKNTRDNQMELDGFCEELKLAFEYHGQQHFKPAGYFHVSMSLERRMKDDEKRRDLCAKHGVFLIEVPYTIDYEKIEDFIVQECKNNGVTVPKKKKIKLKELDVYSHLREELGILRKIAQKKGGKLLSSKYINARVKLRWRCKDGHEWKARSNDIKAGSWCPKCSKKTMGDKVRKFSIKDMQEIAGNREGKCLSKNYKNPRHKLRWQCKEGHKWETSFKSIKQGAWCPKCSGVEKGKIEDMQEIAMARGGRCLSSKYTDAHTKLKFQCTKGHAWEMTPGHMKEGRWCSVCATERRKLRRFQELKEIAKLRGGKCLSKKYVSKNRKLKWQCRKGHVWEATPESTRQGKWCHECGGSKRLTIQEARGIAEERSGKCLSRKYINLKSKLKWQCKKGHVWSTPFSNVKGGSWCPICAVAKRRIDRTKYNIEDMKKLAKSRGGKCLSKKYVNYSTKLKWQCKKGHVWETIAYIVSSGHWCPVCATEKRRKKH